jgi:prophage regulatory protein
METDMQPQNPIAFVDRKAVVARVVFTYNHLCNMQANGTFPSVYKLGRNRLAWDNADVTAWMQSRIDQRPGNTAVITDDDRFIDRAELCTLVPYSPNHFLRLEKAGVFPLRIVLGPKRVAWLEREVFEWIASKKIRAPAIAQMTDPAQPL